MLDESPIYKIIYHNDLFKHIVLEYFDDNVMLCMSKTTKELNKLIEKMEYMFKSIYYLHKIYNKSKLQNITKIRLSHNDNDSIHYLKYISKLDHLELINVNCDKLNLELFPTNDCCELKYLKYLVLHNIQKFDCTGTPHLDYIPELIFERLPIFQNIEILDVKVRLGDMIDLHSYDKLKYIFIYTYHIPKILNIEKKLEKIIIELLSNKIENDIMNLNYLSTKEVILNIYEAEPKFFNFNLNITLIDKSKLYVKRDKKILIYDLPEKMEKINININHGEWLKKNKYSSSFIYPHKYYFVKNKCEIYEINLKNIKTNNYFVVSL